MSSFTKARHESIGGGLYRIIADEPPGMWFYIGDPNGRQGVLIPNGFITDGPSLPSWLQFLLGLVLLKNWVIECLLKASAVHDRMREDQRYSVEEADCYFLIAMKADQKNWEGPQWACSMLRELAFLGVRTNRSRKVRNEGMFEKATT